MNQELELELAQVETLLRRAAEDFPYPLTPDIASGVRARLDERPSIGGPFMGRPALAISGLLAALVIALGAVIALPGSRSAIADFFHLSHVSFINDDGGSPTPPTLAPGNFARPSDVEEARRVADFPVLLPAKDGKAIEPDAVYLQGEEFNAPIAIFVYSKAGYDIYETRDADIQKIIRGSAPVQQISFAGHDAYWVEQGGHIVQSLDAEGRVVIETRRTVDRATLIWEEHGITYRIESSLSQADTVAVAQSLH